MNKLCKTVFHDRHVALGAAMVEFGGWEMPLYYTSGIAEEHLATRKGAGLFDVSHMGRFVFRGKGTIPFLQHVLSNNVSALDVSKSHYTIIPNARGGAVDDAYLYRFFEKEYLLVVNASNREKDWKHLKKIIKDFNEVEMTDQSEEIAMLALQGPISERILTSIINSGNLPKPKRNALSNARINGYDVQIARTGYTGEPICFELFIKKEAGPMLWDILLKNGAIPVGLGARDTLRLEACLPLYGHELGIDQEGNEIPIFSYPLSKFAVSFSPLKDNFIGKKALVKQHSSAENLPKIIMSVTVLGKGIARRGCKVFKKEKYVGFITSGTMVPYMENNIKRLHAICLGLLDSDLKIGDILNIDVRGRRIEGVIVSCFMPKKRRKNMFPDELKYTKTHEWAKMEENTDVVIVGITDHAVKQLGDIAFLELPEVGNKVKKDSPFGAIESIKAVFDISSPVTGEVIEVNQQITDNLGLFKKDPYKQGWMIKIKIENKSEFETLMNVSAYKKFIEENGEKH